MKKTCPWCGVLLGLSSLLFLSFLSCDQIPDILDDIDNGIIVTAEDLEGTWYKSFDTPVTYAEGFETDALVIDISGTDFEMILYYKTVQNGGNRGTYEIGTDGTVALTVTESWNSTDGWVIDSEQYEVTYSPSEETLSSEIGYPDTSAVALEQIVFSNPSELVYEWWNYPEETRNKTLFLQSDSSYEYTETGGDVPDYQEEGIWDATDTLLRCVITSIGGEPSVPVGYLCPYALAADPNEYEQFIAETKLTVTHFEETDGGWEQVVTDYWDWYVTIQ